MRNNNRARHARCGNTLIEVMASCVLASALLVPSLSLLIDALKWSGRIETRKEMLLLADSLMNTLQFRLAQDFQAGDLTGDFTAEGYPEIRYVAMWRANESIDAGGNWMSITVQVWWDKDQDGRIGIKETQHTIQSGTAKRA